MFLHREHIRKTHAIAGFVAIVGFAVAATQIPQFNQRISATINDVNAMANGRYTGSVGIRLTMWDIGIQAGLQSPLTGHSYRMENMWNDYKPTVNGMETSSNHLRSWKTKLHNTYVDTFSAKGLIGLTLLLYMISVPFTQASPTQRILLLSPVMGVAVAGIADSTFDIGPAAEYFILVATLMLNASNHSYHREAQDTPA
jgi:O-antigen ligase